jgi:hypothetical protein
MADTTQEIIDQMNAEIALKPELDEFTNSNTGEWVIIRSVFVSAILSLKQLWAFFKEEVLGIISAGKYGTQAWYQAKGLQFQYGDPLLEKNGQLYYAIIDETKKIIAYCAAVKINGKAVIKVAKTTGPLTTLELIAFDNYIETIKPFCTGHQIVSLPADQVRVTMNIYYDGKLKLEDVKALVEDVAIIQYLENQKQNNFNGSFNINRFRDAIEVLLRENGIGDADVIEVEIKKDGEGFSNVSREFESKSGYYEFIPTDAVSDASVINYLPI